IMFIISATTFCSSFFFSNAPATSVFYTLSLHDALPICVVHERGGLAHRGVSHAPLRLPPWEDLPLDPVHPRRPALELWQRLLPRDAAARGTGVLGAARQSARFDRVRA